MRNVDDSLVVIVNTKEGGKVLGIKLYIITFKAL